MAYGSRVHFDLPEPSTVSFLPLFPFLSKRTSCNFESCLPGNFQRDFGGLVNIFKLPKVWRDSRATIVKSDLERDYCHTWTGRVSTGGMRGGAGRGVDTYGSSLDQQMAFAFLADICQTLKFSFWITSEQLLGEQEAEHGVSVRLP